MPLKPEALDYEGLFHNSRRPSREADAMAEVWPSSGKLKTFDHEVGESNSPTKAQVPISPALVTKSRDWFRRRGHTLSFCGIFLFSVILYCRPYELIPALSSLTSMAFYTGVATLVIYAFAQLSIEGNLTARPKEINLVLLLGASAILSMPMAGDPGYAWKTFSEVLLKTIVIFIVIVNVVRTEGRLKLLLWLVLVVSLYLSVNAINDYRHGLFGTGELETARITGKIKGLFENSNDLALHLVTMFPIAVGLGLSGRGLFKKLIYFGGAALMITAVIVTFSRGGFLGLVAAVFVLVRRLGRKNRVATTGALVFAVIMFLALAPGSYSGRLSTVFNSTADLTGSSTQRTEVLKRSFWVALRYPLFGVGIGNFHFQSPRELETHNAYTQVASEMGLAATVVYVLFLVHPLRRLRLIENQSYSNPRQTRFYYLSVGLQAALVGYMVSSFFGAVAYHWYVYYLVAYAVCLHRIYIIATQPENYLAGVLWTQPFAKKTKTLVATQTASQLGGA
jgi:O-antigen ligase